MLRKTLTIVSLLGLLLSVGLWGVSYWLFTYFNLRYECYLNEGQLICMRLDSPKKVLRPEFAGLRSHGFRGSKTNWKIEHYRIATVIRPGGVTTSATDVRIPLWLPTCILAALSFFLLLPPLHRRRKREKLGLCLKCGYDLRASKDRCPECGEEFGSTNVG